jgi:lipopolysaccharide export system protein LptC
MNSTDGGIFENVEQKMTLTGQVKGRIERAPKGEQ